MVEERGGGKRWRKEVEERGGGKVVEERAWDVIKIGNIPTIDLIRFTLCTHNSKSR